jgi:hypothetical protein
MADAKISALPASTVPLAGTEVVPLVQSGTTKKVSVANLTAGRDVSMLSATIGPNALALSGAVVDAGNNRNSPSRFGMSNQNTGASAVAGLDLEAAGGGWQIDVPSDVVTFANPLIGKFNGVEKFRFKTNGSFTPISGAGVDFAEGPIIRAGSGSPEGVLVAPVGSLYLRSDGGAGTSMYVKESGTGNTGWVAK